MTTRVISASSSAAAGEALDPGMPPASRQVLLPRLTAAAGGVILNEAARSVDRQRPGAAEVPVRLAASAAAMLAKREREKLVAGASSAPMLPPRLSPAPTSAAWLCRRMLSARRPGVAATGCCSMRSREATSCKSGRRGRRGALICVCWAVKFRQPCTLCHGLVQAQCLPLTSLAG